MRNWNTLKERSPAWVEDLEKSLFDQIVYVLDLAGPMQILTCHSTNINKSFVQTDGDDNDLADMDFEKLEASKRKQV